MAGGMRKGSGRSLGERVAATHLHNQACIEDGEHSTATPVELPAVQTRPCWVVLGEGEISGMVLTWRRDQAGDWQALVVAWPPAHAIRARSDTAPSRPGAPDDHA